MNIQNIEYSKEAEMIGLLLDEYDLKATRRFDSMHAHITFNRLEDLIKYKIMKYANDKSVAMIVAQKDPYFLENVSTELRADVDVVRVALKTNSEAAKCVITDRELFQRIEKELQNENRVKLEEQKTIRCK